MSVSLLARLRYPLAIADVASISSAELTEILRLDKGIAVVAEFDESFGIGVSTFGTLTNNSKRVLCSLMGYEEKVSIMPFTVPVRMEVVNDSDIFVDQDYVSIEWHYNKSPLCWALLASVALAVARIEESDIEDNSCFFSKITIMPPNAFRDAVCLQSRYSSLEEAADAFYDRLPKSENCG